MAAAIIVGHGKGDDEVAVGVGHTAGTEASVVVRSLIKRSEMMRTCNPQTHRSDTRHTRPEWLIRFSIGVAEAMEKKVARATKEAANMLEKGILGMTVVVARTCK